MMITKNLSDTCFQNGYTILKNKGVAIVGMSPGNSYFKQDTIHELLDITAQLFSKVVIMIPDKPAVYTYKAIGYLPVRAERMARHSGNTLRSRSLISITEILKTHPQSNIKLLNWNDDIEKDQKYIVQKKYIYELYTHNKQFHSDVSTSTEKVIKSQLKEGINLENACDQAVHYLLEELAFLIACPELFSSSVAYVYHDRWPVWERFINGDYDGIKKDLGFVILSRQSDHQNQNNAD